MVHAYVRFAKKSCFSLCRTRPFRRSRTQQRGDGCHRSAGGFVVISQPLAPYRSINKEWAILCEDTVQPYVD